MATNKLRNIGVITYNSLTGSQRQCSVFEPFWKNSILPDLIDCYEYLVSNGYSQVRKDTIRYSALIRHDKIPILEKHKKVFNYNVEVS